MSLKNRSFLKLLDYTPAEIEELLDLAADLKAKKKAGIRHNDQLAGKNIALIFEKTSTRTRCSFEVAAHDLGMEVTYLDPSGSQIGKKESIVAGAFNPAAFTGGTIGSLFISMQKGVSRGIFSNEAGLGTGSIAHACADTKKPVKQGMFGIFEVFADTIIICTLTAMVILCSGITVNYGTAAGAELTISGFTTTYGGWASIFTAVALCCFAFSTIIGWGLYGSRFLAFLCHNDKVVRPFFVVYSFVSILGATVDLGLLWSVADTFNGLMSIPNLIALLLLSGTVVNLTKEFFASEKANG